MLYVLSVLAPDTSQTHAKARQKKNTEMAPNSFVIKVRRLCYRPGMPTIVQPEGMPLASVLQLTPATEVNVPVAATP